MENQTNKEGRDTEAIINQVMSQLRPTRTGIVLHMIVDCRQVCRISTVDNTLVGSSREKERGKSQQ